MQLVESVAQHVAGSVLQSFPLVDAVSVRVLKPHVAMPGALDALGAWHACMPRAAGSGRPRLRRRGNSQSPRRQELGVMQMNT